MFAIAILFTIVQLSFAQWLQYGGNAQNTGVLMSAIEPGQFVFNQSYSVNDDPLTSALLMDSAGTFYASSATRIYAFDGIGRVKWSFSPVPTGPTCLALSANENALYYSVDVGDGHTGSVDVATGALNWNVPNMGSGGLMVGPVTGNLYVSGRMTKVGRNETKRCAMFVFDPRGKLLWYHSAPFDGIVLFCDPNGPRSDLKEQRILMPFVIAPTLARVVALSPRGTVYWSVEYAGWGNNGQEIEVNPISIYQNYAYIGIYPNNYYVIDVYKNGTTVSRLPPAFSAFALVQLKGRDYLVYGGLISYSSHAIAALLIMHPNGTSALWSYCFLGEASYGTFGMPTVTRDNFAIISGIKSWNPRTLAVINLETGRVAWSTTIVWTADSSPLVGLDGKIYLIDRRAIEPPASALLVYHLSLTDAPTSAPTAPTVVPTAPTDVPTPALHPPWRQHGGNAQHTGSVMTEIGSGTKIRNQSYSISDETPLRSVLLMDSEGTFYAAATRRVYAFDGNGKVKWSASTPFTSGPEHWMALSNDEKWLYYSADVTASGWVACLNTRTGKQAWWSHGGRGGIAVGPVTGNVYTSGRSEFNGFYNCSVFALSGETGKLLWSYTEPSNDSLCDLNGPRPDANELSVLMSFPLESNQVKVISFGSDGYATWSRVYNASGSQWKSPISIYRNFAFLSPASENYFVIDLDREGEIVYRGNVRAFSAFALVKMNDIDYLVFSGSPNESNGTNNLYIIRPDGSRALWGSVTLPMRGEEFAMPTVTRDNFGILAGLSDADSYTLSAINLETGSVAWSTPTCWTHEYSPLVGLDGRIFLINDGTQGLEIDGDLVAFSVGN